MPNTYIFLNIIQGSHGQKPAHFGGTVVYDTTIWYKYIFIKLTNTYKVVGFFFLRFYLFILREGKEKREGEGEKPQCVLASYTPPTGDLARNPGMCPDWESNWRPSGSQASTQSTEPHQPGKGSVF